MRDDDFNRIMGGHSNSKHFAIIFLICIVMTCLLAWSVAKAGEQNPYVSEECSESFACQDQTYQLWYWGQVISIEDLTAEECFAQLEQLQSQIEPFGGLECRLAIVERESL
jgi:hypothetical protein